MVGGGVGIGFFSLISNSHGDRWAEIEAIHMFDFPGNIDGPDMDDLYVQDLYIIDEHVKTLIERAEAARARRMNARNLSRLSDQFLDVELD